MPTQGPKNASGVTYGDGSQSVLAYTLFLDAAPTDEIREATLAQLVDAIAATSNHPTTGTVHLFVDLAVSISTVWNRRCCAGIIGTKWLPEALAKAHRPEVALDMVPSWMDQIAHNATTVWENWEWFVGPNMNSHNHPALTSIGAWLWRWLAGIRIAEEPTEPGYGAAYAHVTLAPYESIVKDHTRISSASATLPTTHGVVSLAWEFAEGKLHMNTTLPPNTAGTVLLPPTFGRSWAEVREGEAVIYQQGASLLDGEAAGVPGLHSIHGDPERLSISIGGGDFAFAATLS